MIDRTARIAELEADSHLDKTGETELRVLYELRDSQEQLRAWWERHNGETSFWDYTRTQSGS